MKIEYPSLFYYVTKATVPYCTVPKGTQGAKGIRDKKCQGLKVANGAKGQKVPKMPCFKRYQGYLG